MATVSVAALIKMIVGGIKSIGAEMGGELGAKAFIKKFINKEADRTAKKRELREGPARKLINYDIRRMDRDHEERLRQFIDRMIQEASGIRSANAENSFMEDLAELREDMKQMHTNWEDGRERIDHKAVSDDMVKYLEFLTADDYASFMHRVRALRNDKKQQTATALFDLVHDNLPNLHDETRARALRIDTIRRRQRQQNIKPRLLYRAARTIRDVLLVIPRWVWRKISS